MSARTIVVSREESGHTVAAVLRSHLALSWSAARRLVEQGRVSLGQSPCRDSALRVKPGQRLAIDAAGRREAPARERPAPSKPQRNAAPPRAGREKYQGPLPIVRHADAHVAVVEKPANLTTMRHADETAEFGARARRFLPPTLADLLPDLLPPLPGGKRPPVRAVHRLDKDTSGLVVFARTPEAESHLGRQFRAHSVGRRYLAIVRGRAESGRIESDLVRDRGDGRRGSGTKPDEGQHAVTIIRIVESLGAFTLVECRLETGRTHQVRIHLGERGTPICGERVYDRPVHGTPFPDSSAAPRLALHAASLEFDHPATGKRMSFESALPRELQELLKKMR